MKLRCLSQITFQNCHKEQWTCEICSTLGTARQTLSHPSPTLWHHLFEKEGVDEQLLNRIGIGFTESKSSGSVSLWLLLPLDGTLSEHFPFLCEVQFNCKVSELIKSALFSQMVLAAGC